MRGPVRRIMLEVSEKAKPTLGVRIGSFVERMVVHTGRRSWDSAVISVGVEVYDAEAVFKHIDSRDERFALDAIFIQLIRVSVRGRDKYYSVGYKRFDESGWDLALHSSRIRKLFQVRCVGTYRRSIIASATSVH